MPDNPLDFGGSVVPSATAQDSASASDYARQQQLLKQQQAQFQLEQSRALLEQTKQQQSQQQANRTIAGQTLASDAAQQVADPAYAGIPYAKAPQEVKQHFMDAYATVPGGGNGVSEQIPEAWNQAQRNATGNPNIGLEALQPGETASVKMNGTPVTVGKPEHIFPDPATGRMVQYDPASHSATTIPIDPQSAPVSMSADSDNPLGDLSKDEANTVRGLANYSLPLSIINRMAPAQKQRILAHVSSLDPTFDAQQYPIRQELKKSFTSGPDAANITSLNTVIGHIGRLSDAVKQLNGSQYPPLNSVGNYINGRLLGNSAQTNFAQEKTAVASELAKLFKGTGSPTESGVKEWAEPLDASNSPQQLNAAIGGALELMQSRADALRSKYENGFQKPKDQSWLNPQSKAILRKLGVQPEAVDPVASAAAQPSSTSAAQPAAEPSIPVVNSQADYDNLPQGSRYTDSNGKTAVKK